MHYISTSQKYAHLVYSLSRKHYLFIRKIRFNPHPTKFLKLCIICTINYLWYISTEKFFHHIANMHQTVTSSIKCNLTPPQSEILRALRNNKLTTCAFSIKNSHSNKHQYRMATLPSNIELFIHSIISILLSPTNEFWKPRHIHFPTKQPKEKLFIFI